MPDTVGVVDTVPSRRLPTSGQSAVFGLARDGAGDIGNRAGKNLHVHLAGNSGKVSAEACGDRGPGFEEEAIPLGVKFPV